LGTEGSPSGALQRSGGGGSSQPGWGDLLDTLEDPSLQETLRAHFKRLEDELKALHKDQKKYLQRELAESFRTTPVAALRQDDWQPARAAGFLKEQKLTKELKEIKDAFSRQKTAHHKDQRELKAVRALLEEARQQQAAQGREVAGLQGRAEVAEEARGELLAINAQLMEELKSSREALEHRGSFESVIQQFADLSIPGAGDLPQKIQGLLSLREQNISLTKGLEEQAEVLRSRDAEEARLKDRLTQQATVIQGLEQRNTDLERHLAAATEKVSRLTPSKASIEGATVGVSTVSGGEGAAEGGGGSASARSESLRGVSKKGGKAAQDTSVESRKERRQREKALAAALRGPTDEEIQRRAREVLGLGPGVDVPVFTDNARGFRDLQRFYREQNVGSVTVVVPHKSGVDAVTVDLGR
jgi:myosin heavy subunit